MNLFSAAAWLNKDSNIGYGPLPIPQPRDHQITELFTIWVGLDGIQKKVTQEQVLESQRLTLLAYSERMASYAVRECDQNLIFFGLLALGIDGWRGDWRENTEILCLHFDAGRRVCRSPSLIFEKAAAILPEKSAAAFKSFLLRDPSDQTLEAMGYSTSHDDGGFRYKRDW